ncbi:hypothetical protein [Micromonospora kangleipakensis]|uniref:hypothetical protein n=1 Tax=Micromonospora kangleipakensis TaxID=1077942 RepID=UPI0013EF080C|nr:hypothetical protein [Micromonospora kangleipakensis]
MAGQHADLATPVRTGTTLLIGAAILVAVPSVQRWRRWPRQPASCAVPGVWPPVGAST